MTLTELDYPSPGQFWGHYKGDVYVIMAIGFDAITASPVVIYSQVNVAGPVWTRPLENFLGYTADKQRRFQKSA